MDMGGDEGGVCMDPAMAGVKAPLAQCAAAAALWWSPFNLSGGVNIPPPPSEIIQGFISELLNTMRGLSNHLGLG